MKDLSQPSTQVAQLILRSDLGGGPRHVFDLLNESSKESPNSLSEYGVCSPLDLPYGPAFQKMTRVYFELPHRRFSFAVFIRLYFFLKTHQIRIIHSHGRGAGIYSGLLSYFGFDVVHTFHGIHLKNEFPERIKSFIERILWAPVRIFICVSNQEREIAKTKYGIQRNTKVIHNGIDLKDTRIVEASVERKKRLGAKKSEVIILGTVTRLDLHKNNATLIEAFSKLPPNYELHIAGSGEEMPTLQKLIETLKLTGRVKLCGAISDPYQFLAQIDIFVSASRGEGLPYSVLEARALEIPCVLSRVPGHTEFPDETFFDLGTQCAGSLAKALKEVPPSLLANQKLHFSSQEMFKNTKQVYRELLSNSH